MATIHPVTAERVARQGLAERPQRDVVGAVRLTTAIQAQDPLQSRLGLRSRGTGFTEADVISSIEDRSVVRTWLMRATIHLVAAGDVRWLTEVIGPSFAKRYRKRWQDIGLTPRLLSRTADALPDVLADGPLTKAEIVERLRKRKVTFPMHDPQAPIHVLMHATGLGLLCRGPERGRDATFALLEHWLPATAGPTGDEALAELVRRYFAAFGPATAADFSVWSGLASTAAIDLARDELEPVDVCGRPGFRLANPAGPGAPACPSAPGRSNASAGSVRLAAGFDNYLIGYRDRSLFVDETRRPQVYVGGIIKPTVLVDGRIAGTWRLVRTPRGTRVILSPFAQLSATVARGIEREVEDIARFLAVPVRLELNRPA